MVKKTVLLSFPALFLCLSVFGQQPMQLTSFIYLCPTCDTVAAHIKANWVHASDTNEFINLSGYVQKVCKLNSATKKYTTTFYNLYQVDTSQENDVKLYPRLKNHKGYSLLVSYYLKNNYVRSDYWPLKRFTNDTLFLGKDGKDIYIRKK